MTRGENGGLRPRRDQNGSEMVALKMGTNSATTRLSGVELAVHPVCLRKGDEKLVKTANLFLLHGQKVTDRTSQDLKQKFRSDLVAAG